MRAEPDCSLFIQKASKEPILEEAELDFKPLEECEESLEEEDGQPKETKEAETEAKKEAAHKGLKSFLSLNKKRSYCVRCDCFLNKI